VKYCVRIATVYDIGKNAVQPSENCLSIIRDSEKLRLKAYMPTSGDVLTIGYGHTRGVQAGDTCTAAEAEAMLLLDAMEAASAVRVIPHLNQNQFDALVSLVFNIGGPNFDTSAMRRKLLASDFVGAAAEFPRWIYQNGKRLGGLVVRRDRERALFEQPA